MRIATILQFLCVVGELVVLAQALRYKLWRALPLLVCYLAWNFVSDTLTSALFQWSNSALWRLIQITVPIDLVTQTFVLVELSCKVLRPVFTGRVRGAVAALGCTATLLFLLIWPMTARLTDLRYPYNVVVRLQQAEYILGVFWILALGGISILFAIAWRERFFQIAVGLFCYSLSGVLVIVYRLWMDIDAHGIWLQPVTILAYVGVLVYWIRSFSKADRHAPRELGAAFSPVPRLNRLTGDRRRRRGEFPDNPSRNVDPGRPERVKVPG